jgi:hypothetical protein
MARKPKGLVFDAWAGLAFFGDDSSGGRIADLIADAHDQEIPLYMSVIDLAELWFVVSSKASEKDASEIINELEELGFKFINIDRELAQESVNFKMKNRVIKSNCIACALAKQTRSDLVTGNNEYKTVETQFTIHWI